MNKTENLMELFSTESVQATNNNRALAKTGQLTDMSTAIANAVIKSAQSDMEANGKLIAASQKSIESLDQLIAANYDIKTVDIDYLKEESVDTLEKMLKSQQSKKSRSRSNTMTLDNFVSMMSAAVAEQLLRLAMNKPKGSTTHTSSADGSYTEEEYQALADDQEALGKAIRNIQSKKSVAKSKAGYDPESESWQTLLVIESRLKSLRTGSNANAEAAKKAEQIESMLATIDIETVKPSDAKALLIKINEVFKG